MNTPSDSETAVSGLSDSGSPPAAEAATRASAAGVPPEVPVGDEAVEEAEAPPPLGGELESGAFDEVVEPDVVEDEVAEDDLADRARKAGEYLALAQRTQADFENYRKRAMREAAAAQERGVTKLARELLPAVDDLDRALAAAEGVGDDERAQTLVSGIKLVHADVIAALARVGIETFSPAGEPFDPQLHEAVAQQPVDGEPPGTIVEVYQRGYRLGDAVLRPARVVVAG